MSKSKVTPLINPIPLQGGAFYTFNSAAENMTLSFNNNNNDKKFRFSKFALLNIPDIANEPFSNTMKLKAIPGAYSSVSTNRTNDWNNHFAESFQNYCLNLETMAISSENYNHTLNKTISERVFFKWLKETGAIRFLKDNKFDLQDPRFREENDGDTYNSVVKYLGDIDYINNIMGTRNSYTEVYFHIPTEVGGFDKIYFKTLSDVNYQPNMSFERNNDGLNNEFLWGRNYDDIHPAGLDIHAFYDNDTGLGELTGNISEIELYKHDIEADDFVVPDDYFQNEWWYAQTTQKNTYYTEQLEFEDAGNDDLAIYDPRGQGVGHDVNLASTKFKRSRLDGISIDWDVETYKNINVDAKYLIDIARDTSSLDFNFNAILVYYDIYKDIKDPALLEQEIIDEEGGLTLDVLSARNYEEILATNLFGVLFLDNVENNPTLGGGHIPRFKKCKPNDIVKLNGNSYGFKLNLKLDISPNNSGVLVETEISNSNTLSMDIYADAMSVFREVTESVLDFSHDTLSLDQRLRELEEAAGASNIKRIHQFEDRLRELEATNNDPISISNANALRELIEKNNDILLDILDGKAPAELAINSDTFKSGSGIELIKNDNGDVVIKSIGHNYTTSQITSVNMWELFNNKYKFEILLNPGKNYLRLQEDVIFTPTRDMIIYINDKDSLWEKGQIYKIYLRDNYDLRNANGNFIFQIVTDYHNKVKAADNFSVNIIKMTASDFADHNNSPTIEIQCIDPDKMEFLVDILN